MEVLMMTYLPAVESVLPEGSKPDAAIIWLHGLGSDGNDFAGIVPELRLPPELKLRFIFPHAPSIPITVNAGYVMPAWYDIVEMDVGRKVDTEQLVSSAEAVHALIEREISRGVPSERIILAGFSQGGAVILQAALSYSKPLAGAMSLSSYFPTVDTIEPSPVNAHLPILVCHGTRDPVVDESLGQKAEEDLRRMGYATQYRHYPMEHSVCMEEIQEISSWIQACLKTD